MHNSHCSQPNQNFFLLQNWNLVSIKQQLSITLPSPSPWHSLFYFVFMNMTTLGISYILAWEIPWTEECDGVRSMESQRAGHDWVSKQQQWGKSCTILSCRDGLVRLCNVLVLWCPLGSSLLRHMSKFTSFGGLSHVSQYVLSIISVCSFICWWMRVAFSFWLLWMMLLWTWVCKCLLILLSISTARSCGSSVFYFFSETTMLCFITFALLCIPTNSAQGFQFFYILANNWYFGGFVWFCSCCLGPCFFHRKWSWIFFHVSRQFSKHYFNGNIIEQIPLCSILFPVIFQGINKAVENILRKKIFVYIPNIFLSWKVPGGWIPIPEDTYFLMYIARLFSWEVASIYIPTSSMTVSSTLNISDRITSMQDHKYKVTKNIHQLITMGSSENRAGFDVWGSSKMLALCLLFAFPHKNVLMEYLWNWIFKLPN